MPNFRALVPGGFYSDGTSGPVSIRANNPGAINGAAWERNWPGFVDNVKYDGKNDTTVFEAPEYGVGAWWELMRRYRGLGKTTVLQIVNYYGGGQDYSAYVRFVCEYTGFGPDREIKLDDDATLLKFAKAMFRYEAGRETPLAEAQILYGFAVGRNGGKLPGQAPQPSAKPIDLAAQIIAAMERLGNIIDREPGEVNVVYVEGMEPDGTPNGNRPNAFDDIRCVISFEGGKPVLRGVWEATTQTGAYYTLHPVADAQDLGSAIIALGQHDAWQVGDHRGYEALVQTGGPVTIYRDGNKDYRREGDKVTTGYYGINQHHAFDAPKDDIGYHSAGCLVGRTVAGHREFMALCKSDPRYVEDRKFVFAATILTAAEVLAAEPAPEKPVAPAAKTVGMIGALLGFVGLGMNWIGAHPILSLGAMLAAAMTIFAVFEYLHSRKGK